MIHSIVSAERIRSDLLLLLASLIWGSGFIAQSIAAGSMGSFTFNAVRFLIGTLILLAVSRGRMNIARHQRRWVVTAGFFLFAASAMQQIGIETTSVGNAAFITSLYVVLIPLVLWIFGLQKIHPVTWAAVGLAAVGTLLLSTGGAFKPAPGDWFELGSAVLWVGQILVIGLYGKHSDPISFTLGEFAVAAGLNGIGAGLFEWGKFTPQYEAWWAVLYSGIFPVAIGFTLQVIGQRHAPPVDASLIFSLEAVFAAIFGYLILNETLLPVQILGCILILGALLLAQTASFRSRKKGQQGY
jgi:drug/metabolite transporter (DMT)-like permease